MASSELFEQAAKEYRATRREPKAAPAITEANHPAIGFVFDRCWEVARFANAAMCAIAAEDFGLADESLRALVAEVRLVAKCWDAMQKGAAK